MLVHHGARDTVCTATVVAPNLLLTARHCVSIADDSLNCDPNGPSGGDTGKDFVASDLAVFTGPALAPFAYPGSTDVTKWMPAAQGARIFHDGAGNLCGHDLALLLLDRPISAPVASLRLHRDERPGEGVTVVGWGLVNDQDAGFTPAARQRRDTAIVNVGPKTDGELPLLATDFSLRESICEGDSGGPVFAQSTGAVIGVISHGNNGITGDTPGAACVGPGEYNVMTKLAPFRAVFDQAFAAANAQPELEAEPDDEGPCHCASAPSDPTNALTAVLVSALFLWARRRG